MLEDLPDDQEFFSHIADPRPPDVGQKAFDEYHSSPRYLGMIAEKFGAESGSDRILDLINKCFHTEDIIKVNCRCKEHGIVPAYSFIVGFPTETFGEINNTIVLAFRLQRDNPDAQLETFRTYTAFPGTPMWPLAQSQGLVPPDRIEGWVDWIMDDYDLEGMQIPWFNRRQRKWIGNISYLSILGNAVTNVGAGIKNPLVHGMFSVVLGTARKYYGWRLRTKRYKTVPELAIARRLRRKIFYRNEKNIR